MPVRTKRIYEPPEPDDGHRLLVMHYWPRGIRKALVDEWDRALAPTKGLLSDLRTGAIDSPTYRTRYRHEMASRPESTAAVEAVRERAERETVTLMCWCPDVNHCHRGLLKEIIEEGPQPSANNEFQG